MQAIIVQGIGFLGVISFIVSYQLKSNRKLYLFQLIGCLLFCIQFVFLGAGSGAFSLLLNMLRSALLIKYKDWEWVQWKGLPLLFCVGFAGIMLYTWSGPVSILAFIASTVSTVFYWTNNAKWIRMSNLLCASPAWLLYDVIVGSVAGIVNESITLTSIVISVVRFGWKELGNPESAFN